MDEFMYKKTKTKKYILIAITVEVFAKLKKF